ncbi:metallo-beta-lactamase family protein [Zychaea mexicana]|uniref:metallo-beta-lactamase family protein n=1 Tax=Zychaea mexicana TaxID=64656 RepID=UPI0022FE4DFD|nr:metallo-beta-lactamase family protein [Zychaea mexicana]KAI9494120.1 metallo-beta-lactamase family protein [Zychaea mexicana]
MGFKDVYNLVGGFKQWSGENLPVLQYDNNHSPWVHTVFEKETETAQYIVTDVESKEAYIIDPVLDYDPFSATVRPTMAKKILEFITKHNLSVTKIIDTHVHADHLTAAHYLKDLLPSKPEFWMGSNVTKVQEVFSQKYNLPGSQLSATGQQFDKLINEGDTWILGENIQCSVLSTPGHTPACMSYRIGDAAFVGDTLFMPDIGTARCDFPGGSAEQMYDSVQKMYKAWPNDTRIYVGHDYPPANSDRSVIVTTLGAHKEANQMVHEGISKNQYIDLRKKRDSQLRAPRFIHPALQVNTIYGSLLLLLADFPTIFLLIFLDQPTRWPSSC